MVHSTKLPWHVISVFVLNKGHLLLVLRLGLSLLLALVLGSTAELLALVLGLLAGLTEGGGGGLSELLADEAEAGLAVEGSLEGVVDGGEASGLHATDVSTEAEDEDDVLVAAVHLGEELADLGLLNSARGGVVDIKHHLTAIEQ